MTDNQADAAPPGAAGEPPVEHSADRPDDPEEGQSDGAPQRPHYAPPTQEQFDWRGWVLIAVVVVSFLVVPVSILYLPEAQGLVDSLGLTLRDAYLTLPMIPAVLLGGTAVWAAVRSRTEED